jgi:hypothetical protein
MCALDKEEDLARAVRAGSAAPPPRREFVEALRGRLRDEFRAARQPEAAVLPPRPAATPWRWLAVAAALVLAVGLTVVALRDGACPEARQGSPTSPVAFSTPGDAPGRMVPLELALPPPVPDDTPKNLKPSPHMETYDPDKARPTFLVPLGTTNVALGRPVTSSDRGPIIGDVAYATDGEKRGSDGHFVELGPLTQWVQIDLGERSAVYAVLVWHYFAEKRLYHDVVVQVSDDPDFIKDVRTIHNNDFDNSSGLGIGKDLEYVEDYRGRLIDAGSVKGRYVRLYSRGNTSNDQSHYVEVEVYGKPLPAAPPDKSAPPDKPA